jgi:hypothetical protein
MRNASVEPSWYWALRILTAKSGMAVGDSVDKGSGVRVASATGAGVGEAEAELHPNKKTAIKQIKE